MIEQLAKHYGVEPDAIVRYREVDGGAAYRVLVNYGIGGIKVYHLLADDLDTEGDLGIYDLPYRELQALAQEYGVKANQKHDALVAELEAIFEIAGDEEE